MSTSPARCQPEVVGFAARVATIVQEAREREVEHAASEGGLHEPLTFEALGEEMTAALEERGFSSEVAQRMVTTYTLQAQAEGLRKLARELRVAEGPGYRSWAGTIDDEVQLITQRLQELEE